MVTRQVSIAIAVAISFGIGLGMVRPHLETLAAGTTSPASVMTVDFDQVFGDATQGGGYVNRAHKADRLPTIKVRVAEPVLPNCEPVASPYADPVLSRVVGHCDA
jgi:hypothetical protein